MAMEREGAWGQHQHWKREKWEQEGRKRFFLPCVVESTQSHPNLTLLERVGRAQPRHDLSQGNLIWVLSGQVDPDDVLTKEEQIYLLVEAKEKCQRDIKTQLEKIKGIGSASPGGAVTPRAMLCSL